MARNSTLTPKQRRAVQLIASGLMRAEVAKTVGVNVSTISRWRAEGAFANAVECALSSAEAESCDTLRALSNAAANRIGALIRSGDDPVALRALSIFYARRVAALAQTRAPLATSEPAPFLEEALAMLANTL